MEAHLTELIVNVVLAIGFLLIGVAIYKEVKRDPPFTSSKLPPIESAPHCPSTHYVHGPFYLDLQAYIRCGLPPGHEGKHAKSFAGDLWIEWD